MAERERSARRASRQRFLFAEVLGERAERRERRTSLRVVVVPAANDGGGGAQLALVGPLSLSPWQPRKGRTRPPRLERAGLEAGGGPTQARAAWVGAD
jgi:hypothetical protein